MYPSTYMYPVTSCSSGIHVSWRHVSWCKRGIITKACIFDLIWCWSCRCRRAVWRRRSHHVEKDYRRELAMMNGASRVRIDKESRRCIDRVADDGEHLNTRASGTFDPVASTILFTDPRQQCFVTEWSAASSQSRYTFIMWCTRPIHRPSFNWQQVRY